MKRKLFFRIFLFLIFSVNLVGYSSGLLPGVEDNQVIRGMVLNKANRGVRFARVVLVPSTPMEAGNEGDMNPDTRYVTYTDKRGEWKIEIPAWESFEIRVYANAFKPGKKYFGKGIEIPDRIIQTVKEGLSHIQWGSFEHAQLYVKPVHQRNLESLVRRKNLVSLDKYLLTRFEPEQRKQALIFSGFLLFDHSLPEASKSHFERAGSGLWFNLKADQDLKMGRYPEALRYYLKGETTRDRAGNLMRIASELEKCGDRDGSRQAYRRALSDFRIIMNQFKYRWDKEDLDRVDICLSRLKGEAILIEKKESGGEILDSVLEKAGKYCQVLDRAKLYYFCHEVKKDRVSLIRALANALKKPARFFADFSPVNSRGTRITDYYKYDLQYLKENNGTVSEKRKLLIENLDNSNPGIPVLSYSVMEPLHGPHTLLGKGWQHMFHYQLLSEEVLFGEEVVVVGVTPVMVNNLNRMSGKIWINRHNGSVLKIEWHHRQVQNRDQLRAIGFVLQREPELKFVSEFAVKRGELRFPSTCRMIESYVAPSGDRLVRLDIEINYRNYQFFMVSSTVELDDQ
jgi:hypothetical protein